MRTSISLINLYYVIEYNKTNKKKLETHFLHINLNLKYVLPFL